MEQAARGNRLDGLSFGLAVLFLFFMVLALQQGKDPRYGPNLGWGVFWALAGFASGLGCWMRSGRYVLIPVAGQEPIDIYGDVPDASATEEFLAELQKHVRSYARGKYGRISEAMPVDQQMHRLTWLRDRNFITDAEYHADSIRLEAMLKKPPDNPIGFRR